MKKCMLFLFLITTLSTLAQKTTYYDWEWKPCEAPQARFYAVVEKKDSGWLRNDFFVATKKLQMTGLYLDAETEKENGMFRYFYSNANLSSEGRYVNGKKEGLWLSYHYNGMMSDSSYFVSGQRQRTCISWHNNGYMEDSTEYGIDGKAVYVSWFDNGVPSSGGRLVNGKKEGPWQFFHKNGNLAALEQYSQDALISRIYYDEQGKQLNDTTNRDRDASFKGSEIKWKEFLDNNLEFPHDVELVNTDTITIVLTATIDEEGNVKDIYVVVPFDPLFDQEALRVFRKSPKWNPAINYNRKVKSHIRQSISFVQQ